MEFYNQLMFLILAFVVVNCQAEDKAKPKIVGGKDSPKTPYQISLQVRTRRQAGFFNNIFSQNDAGEETWAHNCGGSIVSSK